MVTVLISGANKAKHGSCGIDASLDPFCMF